MGHPLPAGPVVRAIERAASVHHGQPWTAGACTDLDDRWSHPCGLEALPEIAAANRSTSDWRSIGATLHRVHDQRFGLAEFDGYFGPLGQDNAPVPGNGRCRALLRAPWPGPRRSAAGTTTG